MKSKDNYTGVVELSPNGAFNDFISKGLSLVDFYADWCMPCLMMAPILSDLAEKFKGKIKFGKINIEDAQALSQKFQVSSIPNMILFKDGEIKERFIGSRSLEDFEQELKEFI